MILNKSWESGQAPEPYHVLGCITNALQSSAHTHAMNEALEKWEQFIGYKNADKCYGLIWD